MPQTARLCRLLEHVLGKLRPAQRSFVQGGLGYVKVDPIHFVEYPREVLKILEANTFSAGAMTVVEVTIPSFDNGEARTSIVFSLRNSACAISRFVIPSAAMRATRSSLAVSLLRLSVGSRRGRAPARQPQKQAEPVLRKARGENDDEYRADQSADEAEPALAQRRAELRLTHDRRRGPCPEGIVELQPEREKERETNGGPKPHSEENRRPARH